jgi:hypothetical protein
LAAETWPGGLLPKLSQHIIVTDFGNLSTAIHAEELQFALELALSLSDPYLPHSPFLFGSGCCEPGALTQ